MVAKKPTHKVVKSGLYFSPKDGELEVGTEMTLTKEQAEKLETKGMVAPIKNAKVIDASGVDADALRAKDKEIEALQTQLRNANDALKKASGVS